MILSIYEEISVWFLLSTIFFIFDVIDGRREYYDKCIHNPKFYLALFYHHLLSMFGFIGWLSNNVCFLYCYIFTVFIVVFHWKTNQNKCVVSEYVSNVCLKKIPFRNIEYILPIPKNIIYMYVFFVLWTTISKIYSFHNK